MDSAVNRVLFTTQLKMAHPHRLSDYPRQTIRLSTPAYPVLPLMATTAMVIVQELLGSLVNGDDLTFLNLRIQSGDVWLNHSFFKTIFTY